MPQPSKPRVLVVEDDPDIAEITADVLEHEGFVVATASNGRHALSVLEAFAPAVIVLDLMMPEMDGLTFLAALGSRPPPVPPVLAVSAFEGYLPLALQAGARATLRKPYALEDLVDRVGALARGTTVRSEPAPPEDETARLRAIFDLALLEPAPDDALDVFVQRVARIFDAPIALVSIVTAERQHWHAMCGLPDDLAKARGTPRSDSFCTHAVVARAALVVQDAAANALFQDNALVRERGLRFYAGVPLFDRLGNALGTLCVLDFRARAFGHFDLELLSVLAKRVVAELEWRDRRARTGAPASTFRHLSYLDEELGILGRDAFVEVLHVESLRASARSAELALAVVTTPAAETARVVRALGARFPSAHLGRLALDRIGLVVPGRPAEVRDAAAAVAGEAAHAAAAAVPRIVGGADVLLWSVEEELGRAPPRPGREWPERAGAQADATTGPPPNPSRPMGRTGSSGGSSS